MAKVTYTPQADHGDNGQTRQAGYFFEKGKSVEVKDEKALAKFKANPNYTVAGDKGEKGPAKDDRNINPEPPSEPPSIANMVYPSQPPGVGSKTSAVPRPEGSMEAAIEAHGGDLRAAAEATAKSAEQLQASADRLADAHEAAEKRDRAASKGASKAPSRKSKAAKSRKKKR